jgi:hypothetical protein
VGGEGADEGRANRDGNAEPRADLVDDRGERGVVVGRDAGKEVVLDLVVEAAEIPGEEPVSASEVR